MSAPRRRILIVDDEEANLEVFGRWLRLRGYETVGVASAEAALEELGRAEFDLVLLDNVLPKMTGMQALPEISRRFKAPVLLMSGHADSEARRDALLLGAREFLGKPVDFSELDKLLAELLRS